ncbi:449_t:CDS:2, partial [Acaulospora morrowiae]
TRNLNRNCQEYTVNEERSVTSTSEFVTRANPFFSKYFCHKEYTRNQKGKLYGENGFHDDKRTQWFSKNGRRQMNEGMSRDALTIPGQRDES